MTPRLHQALWQKLEAIPSLARVLTDIEMPLVPVLARIERNGALVDANLLGIQSLSLIHISTPAPSPRGWPKTWPRSTRPTPGATGPT